jgi:APA family basic amino acid/polyamine antiporter
LRESFGDMAAFMTGWTSFVAGFSGAIAAGALGVTVYLNRFIPGTAQSKSIAIAIIAILALVHGRGLGPGRILQSALTLIKVGALFALVVAGFASSGRDIAPVYAPGPVSISAYLFAMVPVMFSYSGWNAAAYIAEEVREPSRNVPRGIAIGTIVVVVLYLSLNALYLRVMTPASVLSSSGAYVFDAVAIVIVLSSLSAMTLAGPRVYFAMARDGLFFSAAAQVHERYRTPAVAIASQAFWSALLVLSGTFEQLLTYTGFAVILFSGLAVLSLFFVHERGNNVVTFRAWGFPWAPAIFCLVSFGIVANAIVTAPDTSVAGLGVIVGGLPIYWWARSKHAAAKWTSSLERQAAIDRAQRRVLRARLALGAAPLEENVTMCAAFVRAAQPSGVSDRGVSFCVSHPFGNRLGTLPYFCVAAPKMSMIASGTDDRSRHLRVFAGHAQHLVVKLLAEKERRFEQLVEFRPNGHDKATLLGFQQEAKSPNDTQPSPLRQSPGGTVVDENRRSDNLDGESDRLPLSVS